MPTPDQIQRIRQAANDLRAYISTVETEASLQERAGFPTMAKQAREAVLPYKTQLAQIDATYGRG